MLQLPSVHFYILSFHFTFYSSLNKLPFPVLAHVLYMWSHPRSIHCMQVFEQLGTVPSFRHSPVPCFIHHSCMLRVQSFLFCHNSQHSETMICKHTTKHEQLLQSSIMLPIKRIFYEALVTYTDIITLCKYVHQGYAFNYAGVNVYM